MSSRRRTQPKRQPKRQPRRRTKASNLRDLPLTDEVGPGESSGNGASAPTPEPFEEWKVVIVGRRGVVLDERVLPFDSCQNLAAAIALSRDELIFWARYVRQVTVCPMCHARNGAWEQRSPYFRLDPQELPLSLREPTDADRTGTIEA